MEHVRSDLSHIYTHTEAVCAPLVWVASRLNVFKMRSAIIISDLL